MRILNLLGKRVDTNHYSVETNQSVEIKTAGFFAGRLDDMRQFWRCFLGPRNYLAVVDDYGNLVETHYLGRSLEW